jgi:hypothetical protein
MTCSQCKSIYCSKCLLSHNPEQISCAENENKLSEKLINSYKKYAKNCPQCGTALTKECWNFECKNEACYGCIEATCPCGHKFCWECLQEFKLGDNHKNRFHCDTIEKLHTLSEIFENCGALHEENELAAKKQTELMNDLKKESLKLAARKLIAAFRILHDLGFNERILPPAVVGKIIHFAGVESFAEDKKAQDK